MKHLLPLITIYAFLCSCGSIVHTGPRPHDHPYVKMESGRTIMADTIKDKRYKLRINNNITVRKDTVSEYSTGKRSYITKGDAFAEKLFDGNIQLFKQTKHYTVTTYQRPSMGYPGGFHTHSAARRVYYMRSGNSDSLKYISYPSVKAMLQTNEPAYKYILAYERRKRGMRWMKIGGWALEAAALGVAVTTLNDNVAVASGVTALVVAPGILITAGALNQTNFNNLLRAIRAKNGYKKEDLIDK